MILVKTEAGLRVLRDRSVALTPRQRSAFILCDGKRTVDDVLQSGMGVGREDIDLATVDMAAPENWHIQAISKAVMEAPGEPPREGVGVFEQLIAGPYRPYGI